MADPGVIFETHDRVAVVTLNSPETSNSMDMEMGAALTGAMERAAGDTGLKAVVLTGKGHTFSAGANVKAIKAEVDRDSSLTPGRVLERFNRGFIKSINLICTMEKPVVAAVNGTAAGGGLALAMACDLAVADPDANFDPAYVRLGLVPMGGLSVILPAVIGRKKAAEFLYMARPANAEEALNLGLINRISGKGESVEAAKEMAHAIASRPGLAAARTKALLLNAVTSDITRVMEDESRMLGECGDHPEHREMMESLLKKIG